VCAGLIKLSTGIELCVGGKKKKEEIPNGDSMVETIGFFYEFKIFLRSVDVWPLRDSRLL